MVVIGVTSTSANGMGGWGSVGGGGTAVNEYTPGGVGGYNPPDYVKMYLADLGDYLAQAWNCVWSDNGNWLGQSYAGAQMLQSTLVSRIAPVVGGSFTLGELSGFSVAELAEIAIGAAVGITVAEIVTMIVGAGLLALAAVKIGECL